jgi:hypothetical protein
LQSIIDGGNFRGVVQLYQAVDCLLAKPRDTGVTLEVTYHIRKIAVFPRALTAFVQLYQAVDCLHVELGYTDATLKVIYLIRKTAECLEALTLDRFVIAEVDNKMAALTKFFIAWLAAEGPSRH